MSASFGPIKDDDLNKIIENADPHLSENPWTQDETTGSKSISSDGLRLTFYCGTKTFFIQGKASIPPNKQYF